MGRVGPQTFAWDGPNLAGQIVAPGIHICHTKIEADNQSNELALSPRRLLISRAKGQTSIATCRPFCALSIAPNTIARLLILSVQIVSGVTPLCTL